MNVSVIREEVRVDDMNVSRTAFSSIFGDLTDIVRREERLGRYQASLVF